MRAARWAAACALAALMAGCLVPPFDEDLSLAYRTASRMKELADIGPVSFSRGNAAGGEITYLPSEALFATDTTYPGARHGLLVASGDYGPRAWYLDQDPMSGPVVYGNRQFFIDSTDDHRYNWQIFMVKAPAGPPDYFVVQDQGTGTLKRVQYTLPDLQEISTDPWTPGVVTAIGTLAGFSYLPVTTAASFLDNDAGNYYERRVAVSQSGYTDLGGRGPLAVPGAPANGFYQHDSVRGRSIFSWWTGAGYTTYKWDSLLNATLLPTVARIDALLSDGALYHRGDGTDYVYDWDGKRKHSFPVGSLRFVGERDVGAEATLFYTLVYWENKSGGDDDQMHVKVYTIPTADLDELD